MSNINPIRIPFGDEDIVVKEVHPESYYIDATCARRGVIMQNILKHMTVEEYLASKGLTKQDIEAMIKK